MPNRRQIFLSAAALATTASATGAIAQAPSASRSRSKGPPAPLTAEGTSRFAQLGNIRAHYNDAGTGPAIIMLHGAGAGASGWSNFFRNIDPLAQTHRVLLVDQLGYGQTGHYDGISNHTENNARMLRDLLDHLGIEKASLVGNSMGGATALNFGIDYPDRTHRLVFMGTATGAQDSLFTPTPTEGQKALGRAMQNPTVENLRSLFSVMVYDSSFVTDELLESRVKAALATRRPPNFSPNEPLKRNLMQELDRCKAKTLVVHGREDRVVPLDGALRLIKGLPSADAVIYSKAGHWVQYERADEFNRLVADFVDH
jgi:pimeloyl-ACP methyl ester carboxylesterase